MTARILKFDRSNSITVGPEHSVVAPAAGALPSKAVMLETLHQQADPDLDARQARGDMRHATLARCVDCEYQWYAPAIVACPKCKSTGKHHVVLSQELDYKRV